MKTLQKFLFFSVCTLLLPDVIPAQITIPSGAIFWVKADTGVINTSGTAAQNNDDITAWKDQSGTNKSAYQTVPINEPIYQTDQINHLPVVHFDGRYNFLNCAPIFPIGKDYTLTIVTRINDFSRANYLVAGKSRALFMGSSQYPILRNDTLGGQLASTIPIQQGEAAIITVSFRQSNGEGAIYIDGSLADSAKIGSNTDNNIYFGAYQGLPSFMGDLAEVIIYPSYLSHLNRRHLESYLMKKYAILPFPAPDSIYTAVPKHLQFYPRIWDDSATVAISGNYPEPDYDSIYLKVIKNGDTISRVSHPLFYQDGKASFSFAPRIKADTFEYSFYLGVKTDSEDRRIALRDSVVAGDVILIDGGANAINNNLGYTNQFFRTFGINFSQNKNDTLWSISSPAINTGGGTDVGSLGVRLQQRILQDDHIPTCIINGAVAGATIDQFQRDELNPLNLNTIYGSMLFRAQKSGLVDAARVLVWYEGESDGISNYPSDFKSVHKAWKQDYPNLQKIYSMQIRPSGCAPVFTADLRDYQRTIADQFPDIEAIATTGISGYDGCRFTDTGYITLDDQLFLRLSRDFYGSKDNDQLGSPNIIQAYYTNSAHTRIGLTFSPDQTRFVIPSDTTVGNITASLKDYFYLNDSSGDVQSISAAKNRIFLTLKDSSKARLITYLPDMTYNKSTVVYEGPWLTNSRGIGAFSFYHFPIVDSAQQGVSGSGTDDLSLSVYPNPSNGKITLRYTLPTDVTVKITITDLLGRIILSKSKFVSAGEYKEQIDLDIFGLAKGIYMCKLECGNINRTLLISYKPE